MSMFDKVKEFHDKFDYTLVPDKPYIPNNQVIRNIWNKTCEELTELEDEIVYTQRNRFCSSIEEEEEIICRLAKEIGDSVYMLLGIASFFGIPMDKVFDEIHKSNMSKSRNLQGRIVKEGPDYKPADMKKVLYG